ncbi:MAG: hypothetical protein CG445_863, partial [Methanosaeta sp. ASM2]
GDWLFFLDIVIFKAKSLNIGEQ